MAGQGVINLCRLCKTYSIDLNTVDGKHFLFDLLREVKTEHPWHYEVGPLNDGLRIWYDLDSELRKKK